MRPILTRGLLLLLFVTVMGMFLPTPVYSMTDAEKKKAELLKKIQELKAKKAALNKKAQQKINSTTTNKQTLGELITKYERLRSGCKGKKSDRCADILYTLGKLYYDKARDDYIRAREAYEKAMDKWEKNPVGREPVNPIPDYSRALNAYKVATTQYPNFVKADEGLYQIGNINMINGATDEAKEAFLNLIRLKPNSTRASAAHFRVAEFYFLDRDFTAALKHLNQVKANHVNQEVQQMAHYRKAEIYYNRGDFDKAVELFSSFVDMCDNNTYSKKDLREEALEYLAISFSDMPNGAQVAIDHFKKNGSRPYEPYVIYTIGMKNYNHGQYDQAIQALGVALKKFPYYKDAAVAQRMIVDCYVIRKKYEKANVEREKLVDYYGANGEWAMRNSKDPVALEKAKIEVEKALAAIPVFYHAQAQKTKNKKMYMQALKRYQQYMQMFPNDKWKIYEFNYNIAEIYTTLHQYAKAAECYDFVASQDLSTYPAFKADMDTLGMDQEEIEKMKQEKKKNSPVAISQEDAGYNAIVAMDNLRKQEIAKKKLSDSLAYQLPVTKKFLDYVSKFQEKFPKNANASELLYMAGNVHYAAGAFTQAIAVFNKIIADYPNTPNGLKAIRMIANTYVKTGDYALAIAKYEELLKKEKPNSPKYQEIIDLAAGAIFKNATALRKSGNKIGAAEAYKSVFTRFKTSKVADRAWFEAGVTYEEAGNLDMAAQTFKELGDNFPKSTLLEKAYVRSAENYKKEKKWLEAAAVYKLAGERVTKADYAIPSFSAAAENYKTAKDYAMAASMYEYIMKKYPTDKRTPKALYNAGLLYEQAKDYKKAIEVYTILGNKYAESPDAADGFFSIGLCYEKMKDPANMAKAFTQYAEKFTSNRSNQILALVKASQAYEKLNNPSQALKTAEMATAIYDKFKKKVTFDLDAVSKAYFYLGKVKQKMFNDIKLTGKTEKVVKNKLKAKTETLQSVLKAYANVIEVGVAEWTIRSTYMIGILFVDFAKDYANQTLFGTKDQKLASKIRIVSGLEKYYSKAQEKFAWNINMAYDQGIKSKYVKKSEDAFMEMAYRKGRLFETVGEIFRNAPIPRGLSKEDQMAYKDVLEEKYLEALDAALPKYEEGIKAAQELGIVSSPWIDSIRTKIKFINPNSKALTAVIVPRKAKVVDETKLSAAEKAANKATEAYSGNTIVREELKRALARIRNIVGMKIPLADKINQLKSIENAANRKADEERTKIAELKNSSNG